MKRLGSIPVAFLLAALPAAPQRSAPSYRADVLHGRQAYVLENGVVRVSALRGGGHIAEVRFLSPDSRRAVNPMRVPHYQTIEPYEYNDAIHNRLYGSDPHRWLSAGYMGHLLCFPAFGPPSSPDEVRQGLGNHGEAPIVEWKQAKVDQRAGGVTLWYGADLPKTQYRVDRAITLPAGEAVIRVEEWAENLAVFDRPVNWVQHATFGPPFAEPGKMYFDVSARKGEYAGAPIDWPSRVARDGTRSDLRVFQPKPHTGSYYALRVDPSRLIGYFTMYHSEYPVLIGYLFPVADNPWIADWQENQNAKGLPWDGKAIARGIEFGSTPIAEGLRRSVDRGRMLDTPTYRWIGGRQRVKTWFTIFLAEIPPGFRGVDDVRAEPGRIVLRERETAREITVRSASPVAAP